ncbi:MULTISPECIES: hypothetical protein [Cysteiniphilum]|uniref:Uncharacterized protein n=1 Tax=Cysteiniphilum litorale TaxID=2056700 RepID=A0A8J2Z362_9GAMM|nr:MULTISPECIES: hypothetical protein [Cysteiniphilum]GGF92603.1 hypothetical protein GCM10010995_07200 [Cysteiniphilum litorale]
MNDMPFDRETVIHVYLLMRQALKFNDYIDQRVTLIEPVWQQDEIYHLMRNEDISATKQHSIYAYHMRLAFKRTYEFIGDMLNLLEVNGVKVFAVPDFLEDRIDSFAFWHYQNGVIFINLSKCCTNREVNIVLATQLGNLLLHKDKLGHKKPSISLNKHDLDDSVIFAGYFLNLMTFDCNKNLLFKFKHSKFFERIIELLKAKDGRSQYKTFLNKIGMPQKYHSMVTKLLPSENIIQFPDIRRKVIIVDHTNKCPIPNNLIEIPVKKVKKVKK